MRITVVGPGAMGLLWAVRLAQAGVEVRLLDHRPQRAQRLNQQGLLLEDQTGQVRVNVPTSADPQQALAHCDLALVCVKAYHTAEVAQTLSQHLPREARALTLQNGLGNLETLVEALGPDRVLGGITSEGATLLDHGHVRHAGRGQTHLGPARGAPDPFTHQVVETFRSAGFDTQATQGARDLIWTKLVINVGINALTAILGVPNGRLLELPPARRLMGQAVAEAVEVGARLGVRFLHEDMLAAVEEVARRTAANLSSMLQDLRAHRRTEVAYINGAVAAQGAKLGLACPVNATLTALVEALQAGGSGSHSGSGEGVRQV